MLEPQVCSHKGCKQAPGWRHPTDPDQVLCTTHYAVLRTGNEMLADVLSATIETNHIMLRFLELQGQAAEALSKKGPSGLLLPKN